MQTDARRPKPERQVTMLIETIMKREVVSISDTAVVEDAVNLLSRHRIGMLPVVDSERKLVGILRLRELLAMALPAFVAMVEDYDFVQDFGELETVRIAPEQLSQPIRESMEAPFSVTADTGLLRAHAFMRQHNLHDLPVVDSEGRLIGLASWVDVGVGFLQAATGEQER